MAMMCTGPCTAPAVDRINSAFIRHQLSLAGGFDGRTNLAANSVTGSSAPTMAMKIKMERSSVA
jgi:hypothetical protein